MAASRPNGILLVWAGALLLAAWGELIPGSSAPIMALSRTNVSDKLLHFGTYSVIAFIPAFGLGFRTAIRCIVATELVGIGLEIVQRIVPDRSFDLYDVLANTMGVLAGIALAVAIRSTRLRKSGGV
jgi:VanZ family protein